MSASPYHRFVIVSLAGAAVAILMLLLVVYEIRKPTPPPTAAVAATPDNLEPSLNCAFYDFMHTRIVAGFDFAVDFPKGKSPRFELRVEGSGNSTPTTFEAGQRPIWTYGRDDGTPTITSPDSATRIVLYGLKPEADGVLFIEAGIRSNEYRNLGGQCRQVNFGGGGRGDHGSSPDDAARRETK